VVIAASSCALDGFKFAGNGGSASAGSTGSGGSADAGEELPAKCGVTYPDPPVAAVDGGVYDFTVALRSINFGDQGPTPIGLDLDHLCTCHGAGPSCQGPKMICDDEQGRDNAAMGLFNALTLVLKAGNFGSTFFSGKADSGEWSLLLRIRNYNGEVNDSQVEVDWYVSTGVSTKGVSKPLWDGTDKWRISADSLIDSKDVQQPKYRDTNAYVSNSMLVASLPDAELSLAGGTSTMSIHLTGAGVLAKIVPDLMPMSWHLTEGQLVGRWTLKSVFSSIGSYRNNGNGNGICTTDGTYSVAKSFICNSADILGGQGTPAVPCDALSLGVGFTADLANLGAVNPAAPPTPSNCPDGGDPSTDTCP
jgi:hypothetical protein